MLRISSPPLPDIALLGHYCSKLFSRNQTVSIVSQELQIYIQHGESHGPFQPREEMLLLEMPTNNIDLSKQIPKLIVASK